MKLNNMVIKKEKWSKDRIIVIDDKFVNWIGGHYKSINKMSVNKINKHTEAYFDKCPEATKEEIVNTIEPMIQKYEKQIIAKQKRIEYLKSIIEQQNNK